MAIFPCAAVAVEDAALVSLTLAADALPAGAGADKIPSSSVVNLATDEHVAGLRTDRAGLAADAAWG